MSPSAAHQAAQSSDISPVEHLPSITVIDLLVGIGLALGMAWALWWVNYRIESIAVLLLTMLATAAVSQRPLEGVQIGEDWIANRFANRHIVLRAPSVQAIAMPTQDTGAYLIFRGEQHNFLVDVNALLEHRALACALLRFSDHAIQFGARLEPEAEAVLDALRRHHPYPNEPRTSR